MTGHAAPASAPLREAARDFFASHRFHWMELLPWVAAIAVFYLLPGYRLLATQILVMIMFAVSLDLIVGYAGIISLGHSALFGTGAYAAAILAEQGWTEPLSGVAAGAALAAVMGLLSGWVILRTRGLTLLMLTMAVAIMLYEFANDFDEITGGFDGINFENDKILGIFEFDPVWYGVNYWYALFFLFFVFVLARTLVHSPFGRTLVGIRENTRRMHAVGSPVHWRMVTIYVIAAAMAGAAGAVWVQVQGNITTAVYSFEMSGDILIMLILGGTGRLYGAFIGAVVFKILENVTEQVLGTDQPYWMLAIGVALVLTVLFARRGLFGVVEDAFARLRRRPA